MDLGTVEETKYKTSRIKEHNCYVEENHTLKAKIVSLQNIYNCFISSSFSCSFNLFALSSHNAWLLITCLAFWVKYRFLYQLLS